MRSNHHSIFESKVCNFSKFIKIIIKIHNVNKSMFANNFKVYIILRNSFKGLTFLNNNKFWELLILIYIWSQYGQYLFRIRIFFAFTSTITIILYLKNDLVTNVRNVTDFRQSDFLRSKVSAKKLQSNLDEPSDKKRQKKC